MLFAGEFTIIEKEGISRWSLRPDRQRRSEVRAGVSQDASRVLRSPVVDLERSVGMFEVGHSDPRLSDNS